MCWVKSMRSHDIAFTRSALYAQNETIVLQPTFSSASDLTQITFVEIPTPCFDSHGTAPLEDVMWTRNDGRISGSSSSNVVRRTGAPPPTISLIDSAVSMSIIDTDHDDEFEDEEETFPTTCHDCWAEANFWDEDSIHDDNPKHDIVTMTTAATQRSVH